MSTNFICDVQAAKDAGILTMEDFDIEPTPVSAHVCTCAEVVCESAG
jgi:hypothetical protein